MHRKGENYHIFCLFQHFLAGVDRLGNEILRLLFRKFYFQQWWFRLWRNDADGMLKIFRGVEI